MRKSRLVTALLVFLFAIGTLGATNDMNTIPLSSPLYGYMDQLYTLEGHAAAQGARPWTEADFKQQLDRITPTSEVAQKLYDAIRERLNDGENTASADWNLMLNPSIAIHTNPSDFSESDKWNSQVLNDRLVNIDFALYGSNYFAAGMGLSLGFANSANSTGRSDTFIDSVDEERFSEVFATNIPFLSKGSIDIDITDHSFVTVGTPYISATLGRGQVSWGNGMMGNIILGNTLPYHDYISLSAGNNSWFDYSMQMSFFTHPMNYSDGHTSIMDGIHFFLAHRFEFRLLSDKVRLTLNEAVVYQSEENYIDFRVFNPLLIMHGYYIAANANSLASIELEYSPVRSLQLYFSFGLDDLSVGEAKAPEKDATLNMWGITGGARYATPIHKGILSINAEGVYTSPFMYHKDSYGYASYSQDYVGSVRFFKNNSIRYIRRYLSFPFGSDALAFCVKGTYGEPFSYEVGLSSFLMWHGVTDENSIAKKYDGIITEVPGFLSTSNPFDPSESGEISFTLDIGLEGKWYIMDNLELSSTLDFIYVDNFNNEAGRTAFDTQWTVTLKYSIF